MSNLGQSIVFGGEVRAAPASAIFGLKRGWHFVRMAFDVVVLAIEELCNALVGFELTEGDFGIAMDLCI